MVKMKAVYEGDLHCTLTHEPSGQTIHTDAPKDNQGRGEAFSPTDLSGASLLSCILTTMAIYGKRHGIELKGATGEVIKEMVTEPSRRIGKLSVSILMPGGIPKDQREVLERIAHTCPVHKSLGDHVERPIQIAYPD